MSKSRIQDAIRRVLNYPIMVRTPIVVIVVISMAALFMADWVLMGEINRLNSALQLRASSMAPREGIHVPALQAWTLNGSSATLDYVGDPRQTLMFVFSTECSLADANWPNWESIARQVDINQFRLVYANISFSMSENYTQTHYFHPDAKIFARIDPKSAVDYSLSLSPMVLLIDKNATVKKVWLGVTKEASRQEMESALDINLAEINLDA